jgi:hypothetical protein
MTHKSDLSKIITKWLKQFEIEYNTKVKYFRCDNAGENTKFKEEISVIGHYIFEFTAPNSPQQNGKVERKLSTLYNKVHSLLNAARLPEKL